MAYDSDVAVFAVLVPRQEVHTDIVYAEVGVVFEKSVDIFACAGILGYSPVEPHVLRRRIHYIHIVLIIELSESIVGACYLGLGGAVYP